MLLRCRDSRSENKPSSVGMLPDKGFAPRDNQGISVSIQNLEGILPVSRSSVGIVPLSLLSSRSRLNRVVDRPSSLGIPTELGMLSKLDRLYLQDNKLSGAIPSEIGLLSNLQDLFLFNNRLTGSIPSEFGRLTNLRRLRLGNNTLTSSIPTEMGLLSLEVLDIP
mgnify:CR=1 FL=1